jgi:hypothetical protein
MFENRVLRRIFGPKSEDVAADWRRLHNEELHNVYASPYIIRLIKPRRTRLAGCVACMGEMRRAYNILVGKPGKKRPLERPKRGWEDNIGIEFTEIGWVGVGWMHLAQDRDQWQALVNTVMNLRIP